MSAPQPDEYIGKTVAQKYRVEQMIGEGGMGKVYRATQLGLDRQVVLKVLRQALTSDARTVQRFEREAKAAGRLNHPNCISVIEHGRADDGALYICMEYVQGKDLHHILSREWPLPEQRVIRIIAQVLSALADAHGAGVIHRDLKPENIMVEQRRAEPDFVKVLDFGIAKIIDGTGDEGPALTRAGFVCGTPEYMSPEQARGAQLDHRSDLYAVGVILYQLMSGMLPFDSDSAVGFATKHLTEQPPLPTKRRPDAKISPAMERLIMRALSKSPDDRPGTAEQFRAELNAIEKERRANVGTARKAGPSSPSLTPRKVTPIDQQETRVSGPPTPWAVQESTIRAQPGFSGKHPQLTGTVSTTSPDRPRMSPTAALIFKATTVLLVALALGLVGAYTWRTFNPPREVYVPPDQPKVTIGNAAPSTEYQLVVAEKSRKPAEALRKAAMGDEAFHHPNAEVALANYLEAWRLDPQPELALKIGEIYYQTNHPQDAANWWGRYRKDAKDSKLIPAYLDVVLPAKR